MDQENPDSFILIIKDEPYEVILKEDQALVNKTIDSDLKIKERWYTVNGKKIPEINILWHVKGITSETASSLDTREQILLLKDYLRGQKALNLIKNHPDNSISLAKCNYDTAVSCIFSDKPDYLSSCQASLRFACQIVKAKLTGTGKTIEDHETLAGLTAKLDDADFQEIEDIIPWIQKNPEEKDVEPSVTPEEAVNAVRSSLALFSVLFPDKEAGKQGRGFVNISS